MNTYPSIYLAYLGKLSTVVCYKLPGASVEYWQYNPVKLVSAISTRAMQTSGGLYRLSAFCGSLNFTTLVEQ